MEYDIVIVGAGPAGLSAAVHYSQLAAQHQFPVKVCVLEKASTVGAQIISGAVFEPRALNELIPDWQKRGAPLDTPVTKDVFQLLTKRLAITLPTPPGLHNEGNYLISLENLCRWLAKEAENLGVDIFPGYAATEGLFDKDGTMIGVATNPVGIDKTGQKKQHFQPGMKIFARYTLLAEGCRGSLTKQLHERFQLGKNSDPQSYGIGVKELWEIDPKYHQAGKTMHTIGWPLASNTYGGSFILHLKPNLLSLGLIIGLDYKNTYLDPFEELQRFKHHPAVRPLLEGGRRIEYGARALTEGGFQAIPKLCFPGGLLIGCAAGFMNVAKLKGSHTAMKSGMLAAESVFEAIKNSERIRKNNSEDQNNSNREMKHSNNVLINYETKLQNSWIWPELKKARNLRPAFHYGLWFGLAYAAVDAYILRGKAPWTLHYKPDYLQLKPAKYCHPIPYPKADGKISFDKLTSLQFSNVNHEENQPPHLILLDPKLAIEVNWLIYASPEQRYCPAKVYEIIFDAERKPKLHISAQNCIHCKTCDIKDPKQNIEWIPPEGGGGPNYSYM